MTRFNFTERKRILRKSFSLTVDEIDEELFLNVKLDLADYDFEPDALVHIHVSPVGLRTRWIQSCGHVSKLSPSVRYKLPQVYNGRTLRGQIYVQRPSSAMLAGSSAEFQILGKGQKPHSVESLLPVLANLDGAQLWEMEFPVSHAPILRIHKKLDGADSFLSSPVVRALIIPQAFRQIISHLLEHRTGEYDDPYIVNWERTLQSLGVWPAEEELEDVLEDDDRDKREELVDRIVEDFCRQHAFVDDFQEYVEGKNNAL